MTKNAVAFGSSVNTQSRSTRKQWLQRCAFVWPIYFLAIVALASPALADPPDQAWVHDKYAPGDFILVRGNEPAEILVSPNDFKVVQIAAGHLAADVERVTSRKPQLSNDASKKASRYAVIVGTLGHSVLIDSLVRSNKLKLDGLSGQWESFVISTVPHPLPEVEVGLVI